MMKRKMMAAVLTMAMAAAMIGGCGNSTDTSNAGNSTNTTESSADAADTAKDTAQNTADKTVYKVGIVQYVDDASLNQIEKAIEAELDAKGAELGVTFDYADYTYNGQADSSTLNQIAADLVAEGVDVIIPIATPAAMIMQNATEDNQIPVVFSAVSDPVGAGLVASADAPGANITEHPMQLMWHRSWISFWQRIRMPQKSDFCMIRARILPQVLFRRQKITAMNMGFPM